MVARRGWIAYPVSYCAREMGILAAWIREGTSGAVVGPAGVGKSNLLGFLCHRQDALSLYLNTTAYPVVPIFIDLNDLPAIDLATLFRVIVRALYERRQQLSSIMSEAVTAAYQESRSKTDPFTLQTVLHEVLFLFQENSVRVVMVLDRFDHFCRVAPPSLTDTLRALRDKFKETLCYLVCLRQEIGYLTDQTTLGELYEILDAHVCRVRPLKLADAYHLAARELAAADKPAEEETINHLITLTGGFPAWLKLACTWWMNSATIPFPEWTEALLAEHTIQFRLFELWDSLSQKEQLALSEVVSGKENTAVSHLNKAKPGKNSGSNGDNLEQREKQHRLTLALLADKGLIQNDGRERQIFSPLLAGFIKSLSVGGRGQLWLEKDTLNIYQGQVLLEKLAPLERSLLTYLLAHPRIKHTYTAIIQAVWPSDINKEGVSNEALFQVIAGLRRKIEPDPSQPCYLVNWRGIPEGGYQCFPEGRPL